MEIISILCAAALNEIYYSYVLIQRFVCVCVCVMLETIPRNALMCFHRFKITSESHRNVENHFAMTRRETSASASARTRIHKFFIQLYFSVSWKSCWTAAVHIHLAICFCCSCFNPFFPFWLLDTRIYWAKAKMKSRQKINTKQTNAKKHPFGINIQVCRRGVFQWNEWEMVTKNQWL